MDRFELIFNFVLQEVPETGVLNSIIDEKWGSEFSQKAPSYQIKPGDEYYFFVPTKKGQLSYHESILLLSSYGLKLPNAHGLVLIEPSILRGEITPFIKKDQWLLGLDYVPNLSHKHHFGHLVPYTRVDIESGISHCWHQYSDSIEHDDVIFGIKPKKE